MGVRGEARDLALAEQELTRALVAVGPDRQRRIAGWVARRAYQEIGIAELDWVAPALDAVEAGEALPPPFDLVGGAWKRLQSEPRVPPRIAPMLRAGVRPRLPGAPGRGDPLCRVATYSSPRGVGRLGGGCPGVRRRCPFPAGRAQGAVGRRLRWGGRAGTLPRTHVPYRPAPPPRRSGHTVHAGFCPRWLGTSLVKRLRRRSVDTCPGAGVAPVATDGVTRRASPVPTRRGNGDSGAERADQPSLLISSDCCRLVGEAESGAGKAAVDEVWP
ncbi:hypothetical protein SGRIM119S_02971 [Streptomyces griseorubiginosus]